MPNKRRTLYWTLQLAGWSVYFSLSAVPTYREDPKFNVLLVWVLIMAAHLAMSHLLHYEIHRRHWLDGSPGRAAAKILVACVPLAIAVNLVLTPFPALLGLNSIAVQVNRFRYFMPASFFLFALWSFFYMAFQYFFRYRASEMKRLRLEASINEAELRALKAQVNPHFLFNCLNNLRALIAEDSEKAREMLLSLSELLRYSLEAGRRDRVPLEEELRIVKGYLSLEKLQFDQRLVWRFDISGSALSVMIPPMLVQQLVENAIKHGIAQDKAGGEILVWARSEVGGLELRVENTGSLKDSAGRGFGIENVRERLRLLCGSSASFKLENAGEGRVAATARIPLTA
jgi:hypothetical protein